MDRIKDNADLSVVDIHILVFVSLRVPVGIEIAFRHHLVHQLKILQVRTVHDRVIDLSLVVNVEINAVSVKQGHKQVTVAGSLAGAVRRETPGIVNPISIRIVIGKGAHHVQKFIDIGRHRQSQIVQPILANHQALNKSARKGGTRNQLAVAGKIGFLNIGEL